MRKKKYSTFNLFIRSLIFFIYSSTSIVLYSIVVVCSWPLPLRYRYAEIRSFIRLYMWMLKHVCHIDYHVEGLRHLPKDHRAIVLSKHQSAWETLFLPLILRDPAVIAKRELLWIPFFGWGLALSKPIAINRQSTTSAMQQIIRKGKAYLEEGRTILIFPEGTRVPVGKVGHYKLGGARLATATGYPVIPVAVNSGYFWPKRSFIKRPGTIQVVIGPAIDSKNHTAEEVLSMAKNWIEDAMITITPRDVSR